MIESVNNERIKEYAKLNTKKYRDETGTFIVEGEHLVEEALKYMEVVEIFSLDGRDNTTHVSENVMAKLSDLKTPPKVLAVLKKKETEAAGWNSLVLDNIQDPGNLGTIIRSARAFGIDSIVLSEDSVDEYNSKVIRASEGMMFSTNIVRANLRDFILDNKNECDILTTDVNGGEDIRDYNSKWPFILIMGNEGNGVRPEIAELADKKIYIPMSEGVESLNVGVAASILMYELSRK